MLLLFWWLIWKRQNIWIWPWQVLMWKYSRSSHSRRLVLPHKLRKCSCREVIYTFLFLRLIIFYDSVLKVLTYYNKHVLLYAVKKPYHRINSRWRMIKAPCGVLAVIYLSFSHDSSWNMFDLVCGDVEERVLFGPRRRRKRRRKDGVEAPQWIFKISRHPRSAAGDSDSDGSCWWRLLK